MADDTKNIEIKVQDQVDTSIAEKIIVIADSADRAGKSVVNLKSILAGLGGGGNGLAGLVRSLNNATVGTQALTDSTSALSIAQNQMATVAETAAAKIAQSTIQQTEAAAAQANATREQTAAALQANAVGAMRARLEEEMPALFSETTGAIAEETVAIGALSEMSEIQAAAYKQLAEASVAAQIAKRNLTTASRMAAKAGSDEATSSLAVAEAMAENSVATEQLAIAKRNLAEVLEYENGARATQVVQLNASTNATANNARATKELVSANVSAAAAIGMAEGRTLSMTRAAANFMTRILGLGPVLQQAFIAIGAIAMVSVIVQMGEAFEKMVVKALDAARNIAKAFDSLIIGLRRSNDELALTNDKLDATIARLEHKPTVNGAAMAIDEARVMADRLDASLEKVGKDLEAILKTNKVGFWASLFTGQSMTYNTSDFIEKQWNNINSAQDTARNRMDEASAKKDPKAANDAMIEAYNAERASIKAATDALIAKYNETKKIQDKYEELQRSTTEENPYQNQTPNLTMLGKAAHLAQAELRNLDLTMANMQKNQLADHLRDIASATKMGEKEAAAEWKKLEAAFTAFQTEKDKAGHKATPQENLDWLVGKEISINSLNRDKLAKKELPYRDQIASNQFYEDHLAKLRDEIALIGMYDDASKEQAQIDRIREEAQRRNITLTAEQISMLQKLIKTYVENVEYDRELERIYRSMNDPMREFIASARAMEQLFQNGDMSMSQFRLGLQRLRESYSDATNAITRYKREMWDAQLDEKTKVGTSRELAVNEKMLELARSLRAKGPDADHPNGYSEEDIAREVSIQRKVQLELQRKNEVNRIANQLINEQRDLTEKLTIKELALTKAVEANTMSKEAANSERLRDKLEQNQQKLDSGTGGSVFGAGVAEYAKSYKTLAASLKEIFANTFKSIGDGAANAFGRAIVYGENFGSAMRNVAREAISELLSSMVKLALQAAIHWAAEKIGIVSTTATGMAATMTATTASVAAATTVATAWASAAAAVSLAMMGANLGPAMAAMTTASASSHMLFLADGGLVNGPGTARSDSVGAMLSNGEFVVNAASTSTNLALLEAINAGKNVQMPNVVQVQGNNSSSSRTPKVEVHNYAGVNIEAKHIDENTIRIIARQEATTTMRRNADRMTATYVQNANSRTSKAMSQYTDVARKR